MSKEEAIKELQSLQSMDDEETAHIMADTVLCDLLNSLGYSDVVEEWDEIKKWYA